MKKIAIVIAVLLALSYLIYELAKKKNIVLGSTNRVYNVCRPINVRPPSATQGSVPFSSLSVTIMPREDLYTPNGNLALDQLNLGIDMMKTLPATDAHSWNYQTSIHGITGNLNSNMPRLWNSGKDYAHNNTEFFLSWHRMYLYFFERIICKLTVNPNFRIPYWDPSANINLPVPFQSNTSVGGITNHLYIANPNRNRFGLTATEVTLFNSAVQRAMNTTSYCIFLEHIETLHSIVHGAIGGFDNSSTTQLGYMTQYEISPKDPIFFVFHSYIDRLWERWLRQTGRKNPNGAFLTKWFYFYNVTSSGLPQPIRINGSQILNTSTNLRYNYTGVPGNAPTSRQAACCPPTSKSIPLLQSSSSLTINQNNVSFPLASTKVVMPLNELIKLKNIGQNQSVYAEVDDIIINEMPKDLIGVYLVKQAQANTLPPTLSFVGVVDVLNARMKHEGENGKKKFRINLTEIFKGLNIPISSLRNTSLVFKPINAEPMSPNLTGSISLSGISITLQDN